MRILLITDGVAGEKKAIVVIYNILHSKLKESSEPDYSMYIPRQSVISSLTHHMITFEKPSSAVHEIFAPIAPLIANLILLLSKEYNRWGNMSADQLAKDGIFSLATALNTNAHSVDDYVGAVHGCVIFSRNCA